MNRLIVITISLATWSHAFALCGGALDDNAFKKAQDYNDPNNADRINLVERYHFTVDVEALVRGNTSTVPDDIDYTLRQIPNHYRALDAMSRWQLKHPRPPGDDTHYDIDCYFERAFAFKPTDPTLFLVYGVHLHRLKKFQDAEKAYLSAEKFGSTAAELHYNMGLLFIELNKLDKALHHAKKAYSLGHTLPGLRNKLIKLNTWDK